MSSGRRQPVQGRRTWSRLVCMENHKQVHADEHARLLWGWVQEGWMEIKLVRKTRTRSLEAFLIPFCILYSTCLIVVGVFRRRAWRSLCVISLSPCHPHPTLEIYFSPLSKTSHFHYFSCISQIQSISNPIGYTCFWPLLTTLDQDTIIYSL